MSETRQPREISLSELTRLVDEGMKMKPLAEYYGLPVSQMQQVMKSAGLRIRSFRAPQFVLIDDTKEVTEEQEEVEVEEAPEVEPTEVEEVIQPTFDWDETEDNEEDNKDSSSDLTPKYTF